MSRCIKGQTSYEYDANGNLISKSAIVDDGSGALTVEDTLYSYDQFGNLLSVELPDGGLIEYIVDGQNRRVGKKVDGEIVERMIYQDELNPVAIVDAYGRVQTRFVYGELGHVPSYMVRGGERYAIITDNVGSPIMVVRESDGFIAQRRVYDAWGNVLEDTNPGFQPFGFAGGLYDGATGLIRYGARDYDPAIGHWTNKDPIRFAGGDLNLYAYAFNDPINNIDPSGLFENPITYWRDFFGGVSDFVGNYHEMRVANTIGGDKYFHCMANCRASRRGLGGLNAAELISESREMIDLYIRGAPEVDCSEDRMANSQGRYGDKNESCSDVCSSRKPSGL